MYKKITLGIVLASFIIGCGQPDITDPCEIDYQKCSAECKVTTATEADWKKTACEAKCKTFYGACKTKQKTIEGYEYTKEKSIEGYHYIKNKISDENSTK
jgi:hypothetical protein